jgi:NADPH:quinone reductase-like Zn-dependent oxidoreductase
VTRFRPGDEVFGVAGGAYAEFVVASEHRLVPKPAAVSFEQAAAVPIAGITALQAVRDRGQVTAGDSVLVNGASGGVGTFAVQIAKTYGAVVTGVCSTRNVAMVGSIGADDVIDYTREDFTRHGYDVILDNIGNHSVQSLRNALSPTGRLVAIGSKDMGAWLGPLPRLATLTAASLGRPQRMAGMLASVNVDDLATLADLVESGELMPIIDRTYDLSETAAALRYLGAGHVRGKVVVAV